MNKCASLSPFINHVLLACKLPSKSISFYAESASPTCVATGNASLNRFIP